MEFKPLKLEDMEIIREHRNQNLNILRTPYALTREQQEEWYRNEICNRNSKTRFWGLYIETKEHSPIETITKSILIGYGGIENIQWENSIGEISLLIWEQNRGYGTIAATEIIYKAFNELNLATVYGECYYNNKYIKFWDKIIDRFNGYKTRLPNKKYFDGIYWDSLYFSISRNNA